MPKIIGVTGTIGAGKSTVGNILAEAGVPVIDTDAIVHELLSEDTPARRAVIARFGPEIVSDGGSGSIDRAKLGKTVFADDQARKELESIIHPAVIMEYRRRVNQLLDHPVVAILVPLLFEAGVEAEFDEVWAVIADEQTLRKRLRLRDAMSEDEIDRRLAAQWSQSEKAGRSARTIDNSGSPENTRRQVMLYLGLARTASNARRYDS